MNLSKNVALAVHIVCLALQCLVPAFAHLNPEQNAGIGTFVAGIQAYLGVQAYSLTKSGALADQSVVTTTTPFSTPGGTGTVKETHAEKEPVKDTGRTTDL